MIDRKMYMDWKEVRQLRQAMQGRALVDTAAKRIGGVLNWAIVDTALSTGLRVSEIAALKVEDIDFGRQLITVMRLKKRREFHESLAISDEFAAHLKEYIGDRKTGKLFIGSRGPLTAQGLQWAWKAAIKRAGLPKSISIHSARHTMAVHLLAKTNNLRQVQKQLGHSSPVSTANMYADVPFDIMRAGVNGLYDDGKDTEKS